jgi:hypothetical protein
VRKSVSDLSVTNTSKITVNPACSMPEVRAKRALCCLFAEKFGSVVASPNPMAVFVALR